MTSDGGSMKDDTMSSTAEQEAKVDAVLEVVALRKEVAEIKEHAAKRIATLEAMVRGQASVMAKLMGEG
jgi:hypothetical protein